MATILNVSEAASLALHACLLLAEDTRRHHSAREMARTLDVSEAHLAKVLQRLSRVGLVRSTRGAGGGCKLVAPPEKVSLLAIYEAIEGPLAEGGCLFSRPVCVGRRCIFGTLLRDIQRRAREYLGGTTLATFAAWRGDDAAAELWRGNAG